MVIFSTIETGREIRAADRMDAHKPSQDHCNNQPPPRTLADRPRCVGSPRRWLQLLGMRRLLGPMTISALLDLARAAVPREVFRFRSGVSLGLTGKRRHAIRQCSRGLRSDSFEARMMERHPPHPQTRIVQPIRTSRGLAEDSHGQNPRPDRFCVWSNSMSDPSAERRCLGSLDQSKPYESRKCMA